MENDYLRRYIPEIVWSSRHSEQANLRATCGGIHTHISPQPSLLTLFARQIPGRR